MAIPWLIGGAIVAAATAISAAVASNDSSESSESYVRDEERKLERERKQKETAAKRDELKTYADRVTKNLAQKYRKSEPELLHEKIEPLLSVSGVGKSAQLQSIFTLLGAQDLPRGNEYEHGLQQFLHIPGTTSLLELTDKFQEQKQAVERLDSELEDLEDAMLLLEALNDEFR